ncbi:phage tail tape measure protein [Caulobacter sp. BE254]|uniref:phage tail tape measure protein n=1 Tax=Caulobacter sp. BE254 TaxID=2817720 RepID=UPI0028673D58|nr:phage tail tape measure protein [Caulobacter sp. BE254]MDR7116691.1 phage-related minor tail protein [Caulobacter sp. BE254]
MSDFDPDGLDAVPARATEAAAALSALRAPAEQAARAIDEAFAKAGTGLAKSLAHAAADGKVSLAELAGAVLDAVSSGLGGGSGGGGLAKALAGAVGSAFSGARADGGPVAPGGAYLVGERGPELFRPAGAGAVEPLGAGGVNVVVNVQGGDTAGLARSDAQLAQALARAVSLGARRL